MQYSAKAAGFKKGTNGELVQSTPLMQAPSIPSQEKLLDFVTAVLAISESNYEVLRITIIREEVNEQ